MDVLLDDDSATRKRKQIRTAPKDKKKELTANQAAIKKLDSINKGGKNKDADPIVVPEDYERYRIALLNSDQLPHMNIPVLIQVLKWMSDYNDELNEEAYESLEAGSYFNELIAKHLAKIKIKSDDTEIITIRMKFTFKRYADFILKLLQRKDEELLQFKEAEVQFEDQDEELVNAKFEEDIY